MPLANLLNIPSDLESWAHFSFSNQDEHHRISAALRAKGINAPDYQLDPIPLQDIGGWAYNHQAAHTTFDTAVGIAGSDLTTVDFSQPDQVASWIRLHFQEHNSASQILGLS